MNEHLERVRPLIRTRQYRQFTDEPVSEQHLRALVEVARWSGSGRNTQPWRFIVVRDVPLIRELWQAGIPQTRSLETAMAAIAITLPDESERQIGLAYDDGRVAERLLIAASMLGLGAGICWVRSDVRERVSELLELPADRYVRTIMSVGHPTAEARAYRLPAGHARLPADELTTWR
jgi:nitroreductase